MPRGDEGTSAGGTTFASFASTHADCGGGSWGGMHSLGDASRMDTGATWGTAGVGMTRGVAAASAVSSGGGIDVRAVSSSSATTGPICAVGIRPDSLGVDSADGSSGSRATGENAGRCDWDGACNATTAGTVAGSLPWIVAIRPEPDGISAAVGIIATALLFVGAAGSTVGAALGEVAEGAVSGALGDPCREPPPGAARLRAVRFPESAGDGGAGDGTSG